MKYIAAFFRFFTALCTASYLFAFFSGNHTYAFSTSTLIVAVAAALVMSVLYVMRPQEKKVQTNR